jgi:TolB-like protein/class 3 adenylate cyclase
MTAEADSGAEFEIAHVLCTDIVGYSKLMTDEQTNRLRKLNELVQANEQVRRADALGKLLRLPTGDGIVLVFFTSPQAPVECAVELARALRAHPEIQMRMGVHSGPVNRVSDVNRQANVAGAGINIGQRVMDCGDAGHILLSQRVAEDLAHFSRWRPCLHDLGECEVKHGVRVNLVNLYMDEEVRRHLFQPSFTDDVGNRAFPEKLRRARDEQDAATLEIDDAKKTGRVSATRRRLLIIGVFLFALVLGSLGFWQIARLRSSVVDRAGAAAGNVGIESLAVKPLKNLSGDKGKEYFADGMTDELTTKLSQIGALKRVVAHSTMMKYKESPKSSADIAREVNVKAMVEGSVVLDGDQARISVQLIDAGTGDMLLDRSYTRNAANIVQLQNEVAVAIADAVALELTPGEKTRFADAREVKPQAYDYYLQGKHIVRVSKQAADNSIELLEKAVSLDDKFADAYAELANAYSDKSFFFEAGDKEWAAKAENAVTKALELDPQLPSALLAHAGLLWTPSHGFPHEQVITEIRRALSVAPNFGDAHFVLGAVYFHVGLLEEALSEFKRANDLMPGSELVHYHFGLMELFQGRYGEAAATLEENVNGFVRASVEYNIAAALFYDGHQKEAKARIDAAKAKFDDEGGIMSAMQALLFAKAGDKPHAREKIEDAIKLGQGFGHFHHTTYVIACAYALMNEPEAAMKWLTYTAENGYPNLTWFERDPNLLNLGKDPRFVRFLEQLRPRFQHLQAIAAAP